MSSAGGAEGSSDDSLYPIAVLIDELRNDDVQVCLVIPSCALQLWRKLEFSPPLDISKSRLWVFSFLNPITFLHSSVWTRSRSCRPLHWLLEWNGPGLSWFPSWQTQFTMKMRSCWPWLSNWAHSPLWLEGRAMFIVSCLLWNPLLPWRRPLFVTRFEPGLSVVQDRVETSFYHF